MDVTGLMKSEYLSSSDVKTGDRLVILDEGTLTPAQDTKFGRDQFRMGVRLPGGLGRRMSMNKTTLTRLADAYGKETKNWVGKEVVVEVSRQTVRGETRDVIYGWPATLEAP